MAETILVEVGKLHLPKHLQGQEEHIVAAAIAKAVGFTDDGFSVRERQPPAAELDALSEIAMISGATINQYWDIETAWAATNPDLMIRRIYGRPNETWTPTDTYRVTLGPNIKSEPSQFTTMVENLHRTYPDKSIGARLNAGIKWISAQVNSLGFRAQVS